MKNKGNQEISIVVNDFAPGSTYKIRSTSSYDLPFSPIGVGHFYALSNYYVERNNLDAYLILFTIKGCGCICLNGKTFHLSRNKAVLINGNQYHKYKTHANTPVWEFKWIRFTSKNMSSFEFILQEIQASYIHIQNMQMETYFNEYLQKFDDNTLVSDLKLSLLIHEMLNLICTNTIATPKITTDSYSLVKNTIPLLQQNFALSIHLKELASQCFLTHYTYIRIFKQITGITPYQYLQRIRMNQACYLLETSTLSIAEIGARVGIHNPNNFTKQFIQICSLSPSHYRKQFGFKLTK